MYLFFDTETNGLPRNHDAPISDLGNWPRVVQLAWMMTDDTGKELSRGEFIVRPDGFEIPAAAAAIHGITTEIARRKGVPLRRALDPFHASLQAAKLLVAHNFTFDQRVLAAEYFRLGQDHGIFMQTPYVCTMLGTTEFCRLPGGRGGFKWPKLTELHTKLFHTNYESAHDAMADVQACAKCFFELRRHGLFSERLA